MKVFVSAMCLGVLAGAATAQPRNQINEQSVSSEGATEITAEIWVDNYFELHVNGTAIAQDSVAYLTERSFNAERITFNADLPMTVAIELRDYMENTTGLEYIGTNRQQLGDGGAIMQFFAEGTLIGVSNAEWRCTVAQRAPLDAACADLNDPREGEGLCAATGAMPTEDWTAAGFDDSAWLPATTHTEDEVSPRFGYDEMDWDSTAELIWSDDLKRDNIVLCRATLG